MQQQGINDRELRIGVLVIGHENKGFCVYCGNRVYNKDVDSLKEKIEMIRILDKNELKALYKEKRKQSVEAQSKGAGLGLIEMLENPVSR
ncbi:hypothetical protein N752_31275 [Desulforamulus aquiferis]|nr:DUF6272 family protein [Desulforamulus aquiferis]RYD01235.1 hypothetical protein N752_31275 [Desulforamulus aquiferis]